MTFPRVTLAIDNCFASKRWTQPRDWMRLVRDLGLVCVEASADNECDPLYAGEAVLADWREAVAQAERETGVKVVNLYSGHGTYATLGLAHDDVRVRDRMLDGWLRPMVDTAARLKAGLGFFCHAFPDHVLQDTRAYTAALDDLVERLAAVVRHARETGMTGRIGVEQMYSPHQVPWTVAGSAALLRRVTALALAPFYLTIDVGHQCGQRRFRRPERADLEDRLRTARTGVARERYWLGPQTAAEAFARAVAEPAAEETAIRQILDLAEGYPHLFAPHEDGDPYHWLERLGPWSPIVHLQQTDGRSSGHAPFTTANNRTGIIRPRGVIEALYRGWLRQSSADEMPPTTTAVYLTLEVFAHTADYNSDLLQSLAESVRWWRNYVPQDGLPLDELMNLQPGAPV